jgi:hypothetical protein
VKPGFHLLAGIGRKSIEIPCGARCQNDRFHEA